MKKRERIRRKKEKREIMKRKKIEGITKLHGTTHEIQIGDKLVTVIPLYHPAAMLYNPRLRDTLAEDFLKMEEILKN